MSDPISQWPVLKIRADGPSDHSITELSLDGQSLMNVPIVSIDLAIKSDAIVTATFVVECVPDIELPAEIVARLAPRAESDGGSVRDGQATEAVGAEAQDGAHAGS